MVLFAGRVMEIAGAAALWRAPMHPYTRALIAAAPVPDPVLARARRREAAALAQIEIAPAQGGCPYRGRCPLVSEVCERELPPLREVSDGHSLACHHAPPAGVAKETRRGCENATISPRVLHDTGNVLDTPASAPTNDDRPDA